MRIARRKLLHLGFGAATAASFPRAVVALDYPTRPITIVVPFAAGGATDVLARVLADAMGKSLGQTVIVENVTGAAGSIGVSRVARATADGYTLSIGTLTSHVLIGGLYKLDFDLLTDLTPISELAYEPLLICVKNSLPAKNLQELIAWLKANPGISGRGLDRQSRRHCLSESHRHDFSIRAVSRRRAGGAGHDGWSNRHDDRTVVKFHSPGAGRHDQGDRGASQDSPVQSTRRADDR